MSIKVEIQRVGTVPDNSLSAPIQEFDIQIHVVTGNPSLYVNGILRDEAFETWFFNYTKPPFKVLNLERVFHGSRSHAASVVRDRVTKINSGELSRHEGYFPPNLKELLGEGSE